MASTIKVDKIAQASGSPEFTIPTADGSANQFLKTDGNGVLSFDTVTTTALTGSTNTWIPTITAANALTGTANFTYDGSTLDIKNGGTASSINLYCETGNAHYTKIKSGPHSGATSYTLTLPNAPPSVSGQALTATTAGAASWTTIAAGIANASVWRLSTPFTPSTGVATDITANLEEDDSVSAGRLGSAMTESSGVFTFPSTGYWLISCHMNSYYTGNTRYTNVRIMTTINNSSYSMRAYNNQGAYNQGDDVAMASTCEFLFDVTDVANCKCKFQAFSPQAFTVDGESDKNRTHFKFMRLGDT